VDKREAERDAKREAKKAELRNRVSDDMCRGENMGYFFTSKFLLFLHQILKLKTNLEKNGVKKGKKIGVKKVHPRKHD